MKQKTILLLAGIVATMHVSAQFPHVDLPGTEVRTIHSVVVNQDYVLHINLPGGYATSTKKYPVVYLMDSQWDFPLVRSLFGQQYYDGFVPEIIIVGVTWGGPRPNPDSLRARDYTPTNESRIPQSGGAANFLSFMKTELFPFIETTYKADKDQRNLMGCSLGGLFTLFALFTEPALFHGYVAASPAYQWDNEVISAYQQKFVAMKSLPDTRLYMTIGDVEQGVPGFEKFALNLSLYNNIPLHVRSKVLENTGHSGTKGEGFSRGLQFIFERARLDLTAAHLQPYIGKYELTNGRSIEIKMENNRLVLYFSPTNKFPLYAATLESFYSTAEFLSIDFKKDLEKITGFQLNRFGSSVFVKRN